MFSTWKVNGTAWLLSGQPGSGQFGLSGNKALLRPNTLDVITMKGPASYQGCQSWSLVASKERGYQAGVLIKPSHNSDASGSEEKNKSP